MFALTMLITAAVIGTAAGGAFHANDTPIQAAVDNADAGEMIFVWNGSYTENVDVGKRLTLEDGGADVVAVTAATSNSSVECQVGHIATS